MRYYDGLSQNRVPDHQILLKSSVLRQILPYDHHMWALFRYKPGKLAANFLEYFPHAFSVAPSPQHSQNVRMLIFPMNILRASFCLVHWRVDYIT